MTYHGRGNRRIGQVVKEFREERKFSREELAHYAGISFTYVRQIENNTQKPSLVVVERLIAALWLPPGDADRLRAAYVQLPRKIMDKVILLGAERGYGYDQMQEFLYLAKCEWIKTQRDNGKTHKEVFSPQRRHVSAVSRSKPKQARTASKPSRIGASADVL